MVKRGVRDVCSTLPAVKGHERKKEENVARAREKQKTHRGRTDRWGTCACSHARGRFLFLMYEKEKDSDGDSRPSIRVRGR